MKVERFKAVAATAKCIFFDAYGVLNGAGGVFPWVASTFQNLQEQGIPFYIVSNDSSNSVAAIASKLSPKGSKVGLHPDQIICSGLICETHIRQHLPGSRLVYFGEESSTDYLKDAGSVVHINDAGLDDPFDAFVLLGLGRLDWRLCLDKSVNYIRRHPNLALLAPNPDIVYFAGDEQVGLAAGALAGLLTLATNRTFEYFGKPHRVIFDYALARARQECGEQLQPSDILMVGDNFFTDILGAQRAGLKSCLVLSGNTTRATYSHEQAHSKVNPDYVTESIAWV